MNGMADIVGYGGQGYGQSIIGGPGVSPYGCGFPGGTPYMPFNYGWGGFDPSCGQGGEAPSPGVVNMVVQQPDSVNGAFGPGRGGPWGGWGGGPWFGPPQAAHAIQQVQEPITGLAPRYYTRSRTEFVGLGTCCIDACETVTLRCSPCVLMKIIRFLIPSSIAFQVNVVQIRINGKETLINGDEVSGAMFVENATFIETIQTETIQSGCCIEITVRNHSSASVEFTMSGVARVWS